MRYRFEPFLQWDHWHLKWKSHKKSQLFQNKKRSWSHVHFCEITKQKKDCDLTCISDKSEHVNTFDEKKVSIKVLKFRLVENFTKFSFDPFLSPNLEIIWMMKKSKNLQKIVWLQTFFVNQLLFSTVFSRTILLQTSLGWVKPFLIISWFLTVHIIDIFVFRGVILEFLLQFLYTRLCKNTTTYSQIAVAQSICNPWLGPKFTNTG